MINLDGVGLTIARFPDFLPSVLVLAQLGGEKVVPQDLALSASTVF